MLNKSIECQRCGATVKRKREAQVYCSERCRDTAKKQGKRQAGNGDTKLTHFRLSKCLVDPALFTCGERQPPQIREVCSVPELSSMAPIPVWSGNLRLSLVLVPVRLFPATSTEGTIAFRMIHQPSGKPIRYVKGIETDKGFKEVPEEEIIKGYEHSKGHYTLIKPEELDKLKLEAKHTIDMARFVDRDEIDVRYFEKPYYLLPDGDEADEGYVVLRDALAKTKKVAIGQLIMHGREHLVGITAHKKGLMLVILRYEDELRKPELLFRQAHSREGERRCGETRGESSRATVGKVRASEATKRICPGHPRACAGKGGAACPRGSHRAGE